MVSKGVRILELGLLVVLVLAVTVSCEGLFDVGNGIGGEQNTSRETALEIDLDEAVPGRFSQGDEEFWYVFDTANQDEWDVVRFAVTNIDSGLRVRVRVTDPDGNVVFTYPDLWQLDAGANVVRDLATTGGQYYVRLTSQHSQTGSYALRVTNLDANDDYAGNDSISDAHDLGMLPAENLEGVIVGAAEGEGAEWDYFRFTTKNDGNWDQVRFFVNNQGDSMRARMRLYREDGSEVFMHPAEHQGVADRGANIGYTLATRGGTFTLALWGSYSTYGPYALTIENLDLVDPYEPNDTQDQAFDLDTLGTLPFVVEDGYIVVGTADGDADWFKFTLPADGHFTVSVTDPDETLQVGLRIRDESGNQYSGSGQTGMPYSLDTSDTGVFGTPAAGETYYVRVHGFQRTGSYGGYTLTIE